MKTYTIAMWNDLLIAVIPDGADLEAAIAAEREKAATPEMTATATHSGLTLTDDPESDDDIVYSGYKMGWLTDETGKSFYYAVRR